MQLCNTRLALMISVFQLNVISLNFNIFEKCPAQESVDKKMIQPRSPNLSKNDPSLSLVKVWILILIFSLNFSLLPVFFLFSSY